MKTQTIIAAVASIGFVMISVSVMAQAGPPGPPLGTNSPIDGGVLSLLVGAAAYGYRNLKSKADKAE